MMGIADLLILRRLRKNIYLPEDQLRALQLEKLQAMLRHAYKNVPYYRRLFDSVGVKPQDIKNIEDLARIPIRTRRQIQQLPAADILAKNIARDECKRIITGGSSGIPLPVFMRRKDSERHDLVWARTSLENGKRLGDVTSYLKFHIPRRAWYESLGIWRRDIIPLLDNSREKIARLQRSRPDIIRGNPFELANLARFIREHDISGIEPRMVFCMGSLLDRSSRELLRSAFQADVYDFYGTTEFGCIAWECSRHQGYHVNMDTVVLEIVREGEPARPGEVGKIICTGLDSLAMPFIRYDTGDMGMKGEEKCACGRNLPLLHSIEGRADDFFVSPQDQMISPSRIVNQVKLVPGISQFRIIQESRERIVIQLVADANASAETVPLLKETMIRIMGHPVQIELELVPALTPDPAGKTRSLISRVKRENP
jgi:phenylacetate-CoA ligase